MQKYLNKAYLPAMLGAGVEYYDIGLYGFLAPVLVKTFLPHLDKSSAYFFYFLFEFFAALCQICGARYFGRIGDLYGRKKAMFNSIIGTCIVTFIISLLPTYSHCGIFAAVLFCLARSLQSFFLGGEYNGGAIYCLEQEKDSSQHGIISGLYCAFTVAGILLASIVATTVNILGPEYFRAAYAFSFILAILIYQLRKNIKETVVIKKNPEIGKQRILFKTGLSLAIGSMFFGIIYGLPTKICNVLLPMAIDVNANHIMLLNIASLLLYLVLLLVFGTASIYIGIKRVMFWAALGAFFFSYPLFLLVAKSKSLLAIFIFKSAFTLLTAAFIAPFHAWAQALFPYNRRYYGISTCYAIGKCFATVLLASVFLVFEKYQNLDVIAIILVLISIMPIVMLKNSHK